MYINKKARQVFRPQPPFPKVEKENVLEQEERVTYSPIIKTKKVSKENNNDEKMD